MHALLLIVSATLLPLQEPLPPALLEQRDDSTSPPAPVGFIDDDPDIVLRASLVAGPGLFEQRLEVEVKPNSVGFDGTGLRAGGPSMQTAEVVVTGLAQGLYHWRARTLDVVGRRSDWVEFDPSPDADFGISLVPGPPPLVPPGEGGPALPERLTQSERPGGVASDAGMRDIDGVVSLSAVVRHAAGSGNLVQLEVEVRADPAPFEGTATDTGNPVAGTGGISEATVTGLTDGAYRWRARTVDQAGRRSPWVDFNADFGPDFFVGSGSGPNTPLPTEITDDETDGCGFLGPEFLLLFLLRRRRSGGGRANTPGRRK